MSSSPERNKLIKEVLDNRTDYNFKENYESVDKINET